MNSSTEYHLALSGGGMQCWWCSGKCERNTTVPAPTKPRRPYAMIGFFCSIGCANAYMRKHKMQVGNLKCMLKRECGIPFSVQLPLSPPWQLQRQFGPPWGTMTKAQFHSSAWDGVAFAAPAGATIYHEQQHTEPGTRSSVVIKTRRHVVQQPLPRNVQSRLARKNKRKTNSILSYMGSAAPETEVRQMCDESAVEQH